MIILAQNSDFSIVKDITHTTISEIYIHYYPLGAVRFFLNHHSNEAIIRDIEEKKVFICFNEEKIPLGTVTVSANEINRLFVLPQYQGKGYGSELMKYAEKLIAEKYDEAVLDSSLSAKSIYLRHGYKIIESHKINAENGDFLCYDVMTKRFN